MPWLIVAKDDTGLSVELSGQPMDAFMRSIHWKLRVPAIRALDPVIEGQVFHFQGDESASECQRIVEAFRALEPHGYDVVLSESYSAHVGVTAKLASERVQAGLAIKGQSPAVLTEFESFRAAVDAEMIRPLREKQAWDAFFMATMRRSANFSVPGSGKTAAVLGAFAYLRSRGLAKRIVVVSPINAFGSWRDEWKKCFGSKLPCRSFSFHDRRNRNIRGEKRRYHLAFNSGAYNLLLLNYESIRGIESELSQICARDTLLVYDEVHKVKRVGGMRASGALAIAGHAAHFVALTGTPIPNSYLDIYNLLHFICPDEYDGFFGFRPEFLKDPLPAEIAAINQAVQPFFCRTNKNMLGVPQANEDIVVRVRASSEENDALVELRRSLGRNPLALIIRVLQLESDQAMLGESVAACDIEGLFDDGISASEEAAAGALVPTMPSVGPSSKLDECIRLVERLVSEGKSVIVWCVFIRSIENIERKLAARGITVCTIHGGVDAEERSRRLDAFKNGGCQILVTNPHTLAESVSLHGVCHDAVYFECSYNLIHLLQSKDRIHRLGLPEGQYTQYYFMQTVFDLFGESWSLDGNIYQRLQEKERVMLEAIDKGELETGSTDADDLELVFDGLL